MNQLEFEQLCRDTSLALGVQDTGALGEGFTLEFEDVLFETAFQEGSKSFLLMAEVGAVAPHARERVFENLFTIQLMTWDRPSLRFGFNPQRGTVVLCIRASFGPHCTSGWLATLLRSVGQQALEWRHSLLSGVIENPQDDGHTGERAFAEFLAQRHQERST